MNKHYNVVTENKWKEHYYDPGGSHSFLGQGFLLLALLLLDVAQRLRTLPRNTFIFNSQNGIDSTCIHEAPDPKCLITETVSYLCLSGNCQFKQVLWQQFISNIKCSLRTSQTATKHSQITIIGVAWIAVTCNSFPGRAHIHFDL